MLELRLHNTFTGAKEVFTPRDRERVTMYVCLRSFSCVPAPLLGHRPFNYQVVVWREVGFLAFEPRMGCQLGDASRRHVVDAAIAIFAADAAAWRSSPSALPAA